MSIVAKVSWSGSTAHPMVGDFEVQRNTGGDQELRWELDAGLIAKGAKFKEEGSFKWPKPQKPNAGKFGKPYFCKPPDGTTLCMKDTHMDASTQDDFEYILRIFIQDDPVTVWRSSNGPLLLPPTHNPIIHNR